MARIDIRRPVSGPLHITVTPSARGGDLLALALPPRAVVRRHPSEKWGFAISERHLARLVAELPQRGHEVKVTTYHRQPKSCTPGCAKSSPDRIWDCRCFCGGAGHGSQYDGTDLGFVYDPAYVRTTPDTITATRRFEAASREVDF